MEIIFQCGACGKSLPYQFECAKVKDFDITRTSNFLKKFGWILQINGEYIDAYCSEECAK